MAKLCVPDHTGHKEYDFTPNSSRGEEGRENLQQAHGQRLRRGKADGRWELKEDP